MFDDAPITQKDLLNNATEIEKIFSDYKVSFEKVYVYGEIIGDSCGGSNALNIYIESDKLDKNILNNMGSELKKLFKNRQVIIGTTKTLSNEFFKINQFNFLKNHNINKKMLFSAILSKAKVKQEKALKIETDITKKLKECNVDQLPKIYIEYGKKYDYYMSPSPLSSNNIFSFIKSKDVREFIEQTKYWNIHNACESNKIDKIRLILKSDPSQINLQDNKKFTPLHLAINSQNLELVKLLLDNNADIDKQGYQNLSPFEYAKKLSNKYPKLNKLQLIYNLLITKKYGKLFKPKTGLENLIIRC
jgi:hypothetical protein